MSNSDYVDFNFDMDAQEQHNVYPASDVQWIYINDNNFGSYSNGWVNFSNINLIGSSSDKYFDWSQAYCVIPYGATLSIAGTTVNPASLGTTNAGNSTWSHVDENAFALGTKGNHHIIDLVQAKFGGVSVNRNSNYNNIYVNETLKTLNSDQARLLQDITASFLDDADSYYIDSTLGDINNRVTDSGINTTVASGNTGKTFGNKGHLKRLIRLNNDNTTHAGNNVFNTSATYNNTAFLNSLSTGLVGYYDSAQTANPADGGSNRITALAYQYVAIVPLSQISDFYGKLPTTQSSLGFELRLQLNVASNNSWSITGTSGSASGENAYSSVTANQSVGNTCPFMVSPSSNVVGAGTSKGLGLVMNQTAGQTFTLTVKPFIGYYGNAPPINNSYVPTGSTSLPCRIYVPQINYTPSYTKMLLSQPSCKMLYNDYYVDMIVNQNTQTTNQVSRLFNVNLSRVRTMYIIPFLSAKTNAPVSYRSLISSAPTTCSFCRLSNTNIQIAGQNIFVEPLQYQHQFYNNNLIPLISQLNGNSLKSKFMSGQITFNMWQKAYNVFAFDMKKVEDEVQDNVLKSFQLNFKVDTINTYDFMIVLSYQNELNLDRLTGQITSA
jgi:hypothetical protein